MRSVLVLPFETSVIQTGEKVGYYNMMYRISNEVFRRLLSLLSTQMLYIQAVFLCTHWRASTPFQHGTTPDEFIPKEISNWTNNANTLLNLPSAPLKAFSVSLNWLCRSKWVEMSGVLLCTIHTLACFNGLEVGSPLFMKHSKAVEENWIHILSLS